MYSGESVTRQNPNACNTEWALVNRLGKPKYFSSLEKDIRLCPRFTFTLPQEYPTKSEAATYNVMCLKDHA